MRILVTALFVRGIVSEGGSSLYMKCIIDNLRKIGHAVHATDCPSMLTIKSYDLIICSHNKILKQLSSFDAPKVCISQGILEPEELHQGADKYYSVSEEVRDHNLSIGIESDIIGQPVNIQQTYPINDELKNILIIGNNGTTKNDNPFNCLSNKYVVKYSDPNLPIEDQIKWADLCITLGRGAVTAMSLGRPVLVADNRFYQGKIGDGYVNSNNIKEIEKHNFSGRRFKYKITDEWLFNELNKFNPSDADFLYNYVKTNHNIQTVVDRMLSDVQHLTNHTPK